MIDAKPGSPQWWVGRLMPRLASQAQDALHWERYYDGEQPLAVQLSTSSYQRQFIDMLRRVRDNWMPMVVDSTAERMRIDGFRMPGDDALAADVEASKIWQRNFLDADSKLAHITMLTTGRCPVMVWAGDDKLAEITVEHPAQVYVHYASGSRRRRAAAIKVWRDDWTDAQLVNLYLPEAIHKFVTDGDRLETRDEGEIDNPLRVVPVVELRNRLRLRDSVPRSELMEVTSTQDQIDKLLVDLMVASEFGSFRQRWATGLEEEIDPDTGKPREVQSAINRLITSPDPQTKFGTFDATDLAPIVGAMESRIHSIAARTKTPAHYMLGQRGQFPSGDSLRSAETGLVAKVRDRMTFTGEGWEEIERIAFKVEGDTARAEAWQMETIWADPESRTEAEHVDALTKLRSIGVPNQQLWEDAGYTPAQIERFRAMLIEEALDRLAGTPPTTVPEPVVPPVPVVDAAAA